MKEISVVEKERTQTQTRRDLHFGKEPKRFVSWDTQEESASFWERKRFVVCCILLEYYQVGTYC